MKKHFAPLALFALLFSGSAGQVAEAAQPVDLELVLAVDSSSSVTSWEFELQMRGLAEAFRASDVQHAIASTGELGIAVSLVQWSGRDKQVLAVDWGQINDSATAHAFADRIDNTPRLVTGGSTAIGSAMLFSQALIERNAFQGRRKVIDISGDGRTNQGIQSKLARDRLVSSGITVNGLTILNEDPSVDGYYLRYVVGGMAAFVLTAKDYKDFARAIRQKLVREIGGPPMVEGPGPEDSGEEPRRFVVLLPAS
ncbi:DUF1194 domain-containing protein [Rhodovibrionaceae bacterium A322]